MAFVDQSSEGLTAGIPNSSADPLARIPNVPKCRPIFYHNLDEMPTPQSRKVVKNALVAWMALGVVVVWNFIAMSWVQYSPVTTSTGVHTDSGYGTSWIIALVLTIVLLPAVFGIYMCLYTAARKKSSLSYCCFFILFGGLIIFLFLEAIGLTDWGGGGLMILIVIASDDGRSVAAKILIAMSMVCWLVAAGYAIYLGFLVRREYLSAGGLAGAGKEATKVGAQVAYDNREAIKQTAWEHREEIKQVAIDNKDVIIQAAKDNKQLVADVARENPDLAWQAAMAAASASPAPAASASQFQSSAPQPQRTGAPANSTDDVIDWSKF